MLTNAGSGYSVCRGLDVTRWREPTSPATPLGQFIYVRDVASDLRLVGRRYQPTCRPADHYEAIFSADKVDVSPPRLGAIECRDRDHRLARSPRRDPPGHA